MAVVSQNFSSASGLSSGKKPISLGEMFNQAVLRFPYNVAVTYIDGIKQEDLTYQELDTRALQISSCLKTFCKFQNNVVGIYSRKIPGLIACMVGVLRVPAAFAPIGLDWPVKMAKKFIETSGVDVVVVSIELQEKFQQVLRLLEGSNRTFKLITDCEVLRLNGFVAAVAVTNESNISSDYDHTLAYVMQTSGTTGEPTIVKVPHVCIVPNMTSFTKIFELTEKDSVAVVSPYTFDPFIVQLFLALFSGGRAVMVSEAFKLQTEKLCQILFDDLRISVFQPTPYLMYLIGKERIIRYILGQQSPVRILAFGGESCPMLSILQKWKHPNCKSRLFNLYGITEVSSWASCFEITDQELYSKSTIVSSEKIVFGDELMDFSEDSVPLGFPLEDTILEVKDENGSKIDEGVGNIFIGGHNRVCYLGNETSFYPGTMRSTGDLGYIKENKLWFIGRKNRSIKRQAKDISLDWLEQSLSKAFPDCIFCAVADSSSDGQQHKIYLFVKPETSYDERQLQESLKRELHEAYPPYANPDYICIVSTMPLTSHGKVDTRTLLKTCWEEDFLSSGESVEEILENIWLNGIKKNEGDPTVVLSLTTRVSSGKEGDHLSPNGSMHGLPPRVKREDKFVEHGGSSLTALRVANEIKVWFHQEVGSHEDELSDLVDIILNSSFGKVCEYIKTRIPGQSHNSEATVSNIVKKATISQDMAEKATIGQDMVEKATIGQDMVEKATIGQDMVEKATIGQDMVEKATIGQDMVEKATIGQDMVEKATIGQDMVEKATIGQDMAEKATIGQDMVEKATISQDMVEKATIGQDMVEKATISQDMVEKATIGQDMVEKATIGQDMAEKATIGQDMVEKATIGQDMAEKATIGQDMVERATIGQDMVEKATIGQDMAEKATIGQDMAEKATISQDMMEKAGPSQSDIHLASADENERSSEVPTLSECGTTSKPSKNKDDNDRELITPVSTKKRKIEDDEHSLQSNAATGLSSCFCSIQRGMRATTCPSCITSAIRSSGVAHSEGALKASISPKWKANFYKCIDASPLVVGTSDKDVAVVYLGSHAHVFQAVYLSSGKVLWETCLGDRIESSAALSKCGHHVIVGCYDGKVYVLNRHNGKVIWTYQTGGPVKSSPCVDPSTGLVWIGSHDHHLYALDADQRECISSIDCGSSCFSSPCVLDNPHLVFIGTLGGRLLCVKASTQTIKWSIQCPQPIFSSPLASFQGVVYACVDGVVYCCDLDGKPLWEFKTAEPVFSSPTMFCSSSVNERNILFGSHDGFVYCLSDSGKIRWKFETDSQVYSTPFVAPLVRNKPTLANLTDCSHLDTPGSTLISREPDNTSLFTTGESGEVSFRYDPVVVVCSTQGTIYFLSLDEGHLISCTTLPGQVFSSPILVGNDVLVGCRDDFLYCLTIT